MLRPIQYAAVPCHLRSQVRELFPTEKLVRAYLAVRGQRADMLMLGFVLPASQHRVGLTPKTTSLQWEALSRDPTRSPPVRMDAPSHAEA